MKKIISTKKFQLLKFSRLHLHALLVHTNKLSKTPKLHSHAVCMSFNISKTKRTPLSHPLLKGRYIYLVFI